MVMKTITGGFKMTERKDSWSSDDDLLLSTTVLDFIKFGKTQLEAFESVSEALNRTPAACGFRWNNTVRKLHIHAIDQAKISRNETRRTTQNKFEKVEKNITLDKVISSLLLIERDYNALKQKVLEQEKTISEYESKQPSTTSEIFSEDMKRLIQIFKRSNILDDLPDANNEEPAI